MGSVSLLLTLMPFSSAVSRIHGESESFKMGLILDINTQLYPIKIEDKFRLVLSTTLRDDGMADEGDFLTMEEESALASSFEYVMHGKVYRIEANERAGEGGQL